jgi:hypothetical protein
MEGGSGLIHPFASAISQQPCLRALMLPILSTNPLLFFDFFRQSAIIDLHFFAFINPLPHFFLSSSSFLFLSILWLPFPGI